MEEQDHLCLSGRPKRMSQKEEVPRERLKRSSLPERPERPRTAVRKPVGRAGAGKRPSSALVAASGPDLRNQGRSKHVVFHRIQNLAPVFNVFGVAASEHFSTKDRKGRNFVLATLKTCSLNHLACL